MVFEVKLCDWMGDLKLSLVTNWSVPYPGLHPYSITHGRSSILRV